MKKLLLYGLMGAGTVGTGLLFLAKLRRRSAATGTTQQVVGKSGVTWLIEPTGQQMGPAYGNQLWNVYTVVGSGAAAAMTPILSFMQIGNDQSSRSLVAVNPGQEAVANSALGDLAIKRA
jgi:hypothetical protein